MRGQVNYKDTNIFCESTQIETLIILMNYSISIHGNI